MRLRVIAWACRPMKILVGGWYFGWQRGPRSDCRLPHLIDVAVGAVEQADGNLDDPFLVALGHRDGQADEGMGVFV